MSQETMLTPLANKFFQFGELANSGMYAIGGAVVLAACIIVFAISRRVADRYLMGAGLAAMIGASVWALCTLPEGEASFDYNFLMLHFAGSASIFIFGFTIVALANLSLFGKILREETQGV